MKKVSRSITRWWNSQLDHYGPARKLHVHPHDLLPKNLPGRDLVLASEHGDDWAIGFMCPCGCGTRVELLVAREAKPRWDYSVDRQGRPTLRPSILLRSGCRSHFWIRGGRIKWD